MEQEKSINVYNLIILDESGSMETIYNETISAINETLSGIRRAQKKYPNQRHFVSIITFEGRGMKAIKVRRNRVAAEEVEDFTNKDYRPLSFTPLYDAMGYAITELDKNISSDDAVMVTIITDGYENASEEYTSKAVMDLVSQQKEKGWTFAYIGANQDARRVAEKLNISNALNFEASSYGMRKMSLELDEARAFYCCKLAEDGFVSSLENLFDDED